MSFTGNTHDAWSPVPGRAVAAQRREIACFVAPRCDRGLRRSPRSNLPLGPWRAFESVKLPLQRFSQPPLVCAFAMSVLHVEEAELHQLREFFDGRYGSPPSGVCLIDYSTPLRMTDDYYVP